MAKGNTITILALLVCCLVVPNDMARSSTAAPVVNVGAGGMSCGEWLRNQSQRRAGASSGTLSVAMGASWLQGYEYGLMSHDIRVEAVDVIPDGDSIEAWIDKFCADHPIDLVSDAAWALHVQLLRRLRP